MKFRLLVGVLVGLFAIGVAGADQSDETSQVTFDGSVQIPGQVLHAGTYTFKLFGPEADRHIVLILNEDGTRLIRTVVALSNSNLHPSDKAVLIYGEHAVGKPPALEAWFAPGSRFAQVFVYPKSEATELSRLNNTLVPAFGGEESRIDNGNVRAGDVTNLPPRASSASRTLPHTASGLPLVAFAGAALIVLAAGLRLFRRGLLG